MNAVTYTKSGSKSSSPVKLDKKIFGVNTDNHELLKQAYLAYQAAKRVNPAKSKSRGQVRGGGRKPIRQKGTGNARVGSIRTPIWRGGGVVFGPTGMENYNRKINQKAKRLALRQALSLVAGQNKLIVIDDLVFATGKTKDAATLLGKLQADGHVLVVVDNRSPEAEKPLRNLRGVKLITAKQLNVYDLLNADKTLATKAALSVVDQWLGNEK